MKSKILLSVFVICLIFVLVGCSGVVSPIAEENQEENVTGEWLSIENEFFIIKYCSGYKNDAEKILNYCHFARDTVMSKYPHKLSYKPAVLVYDRLHWSLDEGTMMTECGSTSGEVYILAPSDQTNPYYDTLWYQKNIIHEYTHLPFYHDLYSKPQGYKDCPSWFSQGLAEYFAMFCSTSSILQKYEYALSEIKNMVKNGNGYLVSVGENVYYGGAYIVKYMYEVYGQDKVANLIKSNALSFSQAINKELNVTSGEFEDEWLKWACKEFDADYEQLYAPE